MHSLPHAVATMLDPANCGPAFLALPQDVQAEAFDFPDRFFEPTVHDDRPTACRSSSSCGVPPSVHPPRQPAADHRRRRRALLGCRGRARRVRRDATTSPSSRRWPARRRCSRPTRSTPDRSASPAARRRTRSPPRPMSSSPSAPACRTSRPVRGRRSRRTARFVGINAAGFDAVKHSPHPGRRRCPRVPARADADRSTTGADRPTGPNAPLARPQAYHAYIDKIAAPTEGGVADVRPGGRCDRPARRRRATTRSRRRAGFPGELNNGWRAKGVDSFDCEYGFSCMGYEISGAWGAKMALPDREVISVRRRRLVPDDELRPVLARCSPGTS